MDTVPQSPITVCCSSCGKRLKVPGRLAGKRGKCPACGEVIDVPEVAANMPAPEEAPADKTSELPPEAVRPLLPAEAASLGGWLGHFPANSRLILIGMLCTGFLALLFGGIGLAVLLTRKTHTLQGTLIILAVFGTLTGLPLVGLYFLRMGTKRWACVYEGGLVTFNGRRAEAYRWDDLNALFEQRVAWHYDGGHVGTTHHVRLRFKNGRKLTLDHTFAEIEQLASLVRALVDECQLPKFRTMLQQGRSVGFDGVEMQTTGLDKGEGPLTWSQIESVAVETEGAYHVVVRRTGQKAPWLKRPVPKFPNLSAFMQLLQEHDVAVR